MIRTGLLVVLGVLATPGLSHGTPTIGSLSLRGLQIGATTTLVIQGTELTPDLHVLFDAPLANQEVQPGANDKRVEVALTLAAEARPGIYALRVVTPRGISNPVAVGVDGLPQQPFAPEIASLPVALSGNVAGGQILETRFAGAKGQRIVLEIESARIGAKLRPVLRLEDPRGVQLAWSQSQRMIGGDARIDTVLPADGQYTIQLHDLLYRAPAPGFFRLKVGDLHYADLAFPLGIERGKEAEVALVSTSLPSETKSPVPPAPPGPSRQIAAPLPAAPGMTGDQPLLVMSNFPELVETPATDGALQTLPSPPVAISGRLAKNGEEDRYVVEVPPGAKIRVSVIARQAGSPLDGVLSLRNEQGGQLAANDDRPGAADPSVDYDVPADVSRLVVAIKDLLRRGGDSFVYRIAVENLSQPRFSLTLASDRINLPAGATQVVKVEAQRQGYDGPIELLLEPLPAGVTAEGTTIAPSQTIGLLTLSATPEAAARGVISVVGRAADGKTDYTAVAQTPPSELSQLYPWMQDDLGFAVAAPAPLGVKWEMSSPEGLVLGKNTPIQVTIERKDPQVGPVRVRLLTTQTPPKKKEKKDNQEVEVDDVERTLRLAAEAMIPPDANQGSFEIVTPADLPTQEWGVVLVAEALAADGQTVIASVATPTRRLTPSSAPGTN